MVLIVKSVFIGLVAKILRSVSKHISYYSGKILFGRGASLNEATVLKTNRSI